MKVVGGLFGKGATEAGDSAAADATDEAASAAESEGAGTRSQSRSGEEESGGSCSIHSFTGATQVLMADGTTKAIDHVRVGDTITNSVPGATGTEAHKVTAVIVTHTDHDFVDLTIKKTAKSAAKQSMAGGEKSLARKVARKAAFGLAASAAVLGALAASHGHGQEPATAPVSAVSSAASTQDTKAVVRTETAQSAHLTTTFHHPFYDETQSAFVDAKDLRTGDVLQTPTGTAEVTGVRLYHANSTTYDLTIGTLHTYYVEAGSTPVLVHNANAVAKCGRAAPGYQYRGASQYKDLKDIDSVTGKLKTTNVPGTEINHMPANQSSPLKLRYGPSIQMDEADHVATSSWGRGDGPEAWRATQADLISQGRADEAMQMDIDDVVSRFPGKYNNAIGQMIDDLPNNARYQAIRRVPSMLHVQLTLF
ncbi:polymorphic toxin-type HINT domain-containing protein [Streptomyces mirabilis]|nr:polymorphic toxin-type HINT domain-containing protein [Streptomyces mirabilis]